jgi:hypothetical protein
MPTKLTTPSIESELIPFTFYQVNNPDGSLKVFLAKTQIEALKQLEEFLKIQEEPEETILSNNQEI